MAKTVYEIRCRHNRQREGKHDITCNRLLARITEDYVLLICPNDGEKYMVTRKGATGFNIHSYSGNPLLKSKGEKHA